MKRFVFFFAFTCMALCILGETPSNQSVTGSRIAKMDTYDFTWDDENAVANVIADSKTLTGKHCKIDVILGSYYLVNFYGDYKIPIIINEETGEVKIKCGAKLDALLENEYSVVNQIMLSGSNSITTWTLYAMPLSWLEGGDSADYICGTISGDSISFSDDFGFLVKMTHGSETTWSLSPIMKNFTLYKPNGVHACVNYNKKPNSNSGSGTLVDVPSTAETDGTHGVVHRPIDPRPGKPVTPRQFNSTIGLTDRGQGDISSYSRIVVDNTVEVSPQAVYGLPEFHEIYIEQINDTTLRVFNLFGKDYIWNYMYINPINGMVQFPKQEICREGVKLYNYSSDPSQGGNLVPGNICTCSSNQIFFGETYLCSSQGLKIAHYTDNEISFNGFTLNVQEYVCTAPESLSAIYNSTSAVVEWEDNDDMTWNLRYKPVLNISSSNIYSDMDALVDETDEDLTKEDNYDGIWILPSDNNDEKVKRRPLSFIYQRILKDVFEGLPNGGYVEPAQWTYISNLTETSCNIEGLQPGTTYEVQVQAVYNGYTGVWTSPFYFTTDLGPMLGDVNKDDAIGIADVTTLIDALLNEDQNTRSTAFDSGDVDEDGMITIADVTILLDYLLSDAK